MNRYEYIVTLKDSSVVKVNDWKTVSWSKDPERLRFVQDHGEHVTIMRDCILMITKRRVRNEGSD